MKKGDLVQIDASILPRSAKQYGHLWVVLEVYIGGFIDIKSVATGSVFERLGSKYFKEVPDEEG